MNEHTIEYVIKLTAPKKWNENSVSVVSKILHDKSMEARLAASGMANEWTKHGEPVRFETEVRLVIK